MAKSRLRARAEKDDAIDTLVERLARAEIAVLTEYRGLSVADLQDLRGRLRPVGVDYVVAPDGTPHLLEVNHIPNVTRFPEVRAAYLDYAAAWVGHSGVAVAPVVR